MKRLIPTLGLLVALTAHATSFDYSTATQNLTGTAPTLATQGAPLFKKGKQSRGYRVLVSAGAGHTLTGGSLQCYYYSPVTLRWARCRSELDITVETGSRDFVSYDFETIVGYGRVFYVTNGVTVSSGSTVNTTIEVTYVD